MIYSETTSLVGNPEEKGYITGLGSFLRIRDLSPILGTPALGLAPGRWAPLADLKTSEAVRNRLLLKGPHTDLLALSPSAAAAD